MDTHEGHAHHDDYDPRKELLKKFIDALKEVLGDIYELFRCQPELRPILGPSMSYSYTVPSGLLTFVSHLRYQMHHRRVTQWHGKTRGYHHRLETSA
jgi:citrate synthase